MNRYAFFPLTLSLAALACVSVLPPRPALEWDTSPETVIIESYDVGGLAPVNYYKNYIPDARVFGDGRIIWTEWQDARRLVLEGHLTDAELRALLEEFAAAGFFGWEDFYEPDSIIYDAPISTLRVNLLSTHKSVSEYVEGAPAQFSTLRARVGSGVGISGTPYEPTNGYLTATPINSTNTPPTAFWPDEAVGLRLAEATGGLHLEGEALASAWQILSESQYAVVESDGALYTLTLQIPGLSYEAPP